MDAMLNEPTISSNGVVRPTAVTVNLSRITENYRAVETAVSPAKVMVVLKANAYGHGLVEVAKHVVTLGIPYIGVAFLEEGILLREAGIDTPILVMGGILGNQIPLFLQHNLTLTASSRIDIGHQTTKPDRSFGHRKAGRHSRSEAPNHGFG